MPYLRQRQKIPPAGRVPIKLTPAQRDQLIAHPSLPRGLGHFLHGAPVKEGKLRVRLTSPELDALILTAVALPAPTPAAKRALDVFLSYLETQADRFDEPD
jgi:hypothetical protein